MLSFSKNAAYKRLQQIKYPYKRLLHMLVGLITLLLVTIVPGVCFVGGMFAYGAYKGIVATTPKITIEDLRPIGYSTSLYDVKGNKITTLVASDANRVYTTIDKIPECVQHAFVAIEDRHFYEHNGIDIVGIIRAARVGFTSGSFSQGASTITQQLVKNSVFTNWTSESNSERWKRKVQEQQIALNIENKEHLSKETILELYLNTINMGQNTLGIQSASQRYFDKNSSELTLSEGAVLAAIPQNPSKYNPITHPENNSERRLKVLKDMLSSKFITEKEYKEALEDPVYSRIRQVNKEKEVESNNSYYVDAVITQVINDLQNTLGYTEQQAYYLLYSGGLTIYTALDPTIQKICDDYVSDESNFPQGTKYTFQLTGSVRTVSGDYIQLSEKKLYNILNIKQTVYDSTEDIDKVLQEYRQHLIQAGYQDIDMHSYYIPQPQISASIIDQSTGQVRAVIGGRGDKVSSRTFNRSTDSMRQPGSTFKVLAAYLPAFDTGEKTLNSTQVDEPFNYANGRPVKNYYSGYKGTQTLRSGIEQSLNIVTVKTLTDITPQVGFDYLKKLGFTTLVQDKEKDGKVYTDITQSLALGGITYGVKNVELCAAYAAIANLGVYNRPSFYIKVVDHEGNVLLEQDHPKQVCKSSTAYMLTSAMQDVIKKGTGKACAFEGQDLAGKTGTTSDNKDVWFAGFSPYYTCVTWAGCDNNDVLRTAEGRALAKSAWKSLMEKIHKDLPYKQFRKPSSVQIMEVCSHSHEIATDRCPNTYMEIFDKDAIPTKHCTSSHTVEVPVYHHRTPSQPSQPQLTPEQQQALLNLLLQQAAQQQANQ